MGGEVVFHVSIILILTYYCFDIIWPAETNFKRNGQNMTPSSQPVALITGASSGIGRASALALAKVGYRVFGTSRKPIAAPAIGITMLVADVTDDASVQTLIAEVMTAAGRIDLLVNNAGYALSGAAEESSIGQVQALFENNFHGVVRVTNAVLPIMRTQGVGRILNVGSVVGLIPGPFGAYYSASKHAIEGYSESLDHEVRPFGIRVAVIEPWATKTSIEANSPQGDHPVAAYARTVARYRTAFDAAMAAGDTAEDVAATIITAARDRSPRLRYPSGKAARQTSFARRFLPRSLFDRTLRKQFNIA
jgi:short-subunit dehydrogenase